MAEDEGQEEELDDEDLETEQNVVASLIHGMRSEDTSALFQMYVVARKHFGQGGARRITHTLVPLVFRSIQLALRIKTVIVRAHFTSLAQGSASPVRFGRC